MPAHTVLIIDDVGPIRDGVRLILEDAGFTVREARNGREGLDLLRASDTPLVVLLDLMMPHMSGIELLHAVAAEPTLASRDAYIIFSAARAFSASTVRFFLPHKHLFNLPKPFDLDELVSIVEQAALKLDNEAALREGETKADAPVQGAGTQGTTDGTTDGTARDEPGRRGTSRDEPGRAGTARLSRHQGRWCAPAPCPAGDTHRQAPKHAVPRATAVYGCPFPCYVIQCQDVSPLGTSPAEGSGRGRWWR